MQHLEISANTINAFNKIDEDWLYCAMFDNTCDKYEGIWDSCYLFNYLGCNYEFVVNEQGARFMSSLVNDIKNFNEDEENSYFVVGAELNYIEDCEIKEHCDDLNFDNRRLRVFLPIYTESYESFIFIEGKEYPVEYGKPILFDCTKPHSGDIDSKVWALIIDLLPKQIETSDILKYLVPPSLYYVNKMREEQKQQK